MYKLQEKSDKEITTNNGTTLNPVATLEGEYGGRVQICIDDNCYILCVRGATEKYNFSYHWFAEAAQALKTLPDLE